MTLWNFEYPTVKQIAENKETAVLHRKGDRHMTFTG